MEYQPNDSRVSPLPTSARPEEWLIGGGEMGKLIRSMDWTESPLGPIESWPQSLRTTVSLCMASDFPIAVVWGSQFIQIYNDGFWAICGGKHPRSMGQNFRECWDEAWPEVGQAFDRALVGETSYLENQTVFLDRNGFLEECCFTHSFSPIRDESGKVGGLFHPVTEITSKMLSERRTRALRDLARAARAHTMEEACRLAVQTLDECPLDLPFVLFYMFNANRTEAKLVAKTGLLAGNAACMSSLNLQTPQPQDWPLLDVATSGQLRCFDDIQDRFGHLSNRTYTESVKSAMALPITPPGCDQPIGILIAGVSTRLPLDESYRAFYDLLAAGVTSVIASARAYEVETKRAEGFEEIDRVKTTFFSNVSHEFRTPLTLILGPLEDELAESVDPLPESRKERIQTAHRNSLRLLKLVNKLLDFSRIEAGRMHASYEETDLAAHTIDLASAFRSAVEKAGLTLTIDCPTLPKAVFIDREMWEKIVLNLLSNAVKHTFRGGITVKLTWCGDYVELTVADTGVGIAKVALPRLFERFHRVKGAESRTHEGSGIGLALVQELVLLHGGTVSVESTEAQGTTFTVKVKTGKAHLPEDHMCEKRNLTSTSAGAAPYVEEALHWMPQVVAPEYQVPPSDESPHLAGFHETPQAYVSRRPRVLWADDNADMREYVRRLLSDRYDVTTVSDGLAALDSAQQDPPDLILSDIMMPRLDGMELVRKLRSHTRTRAIPVILLSARARQESTIEGLEAGADDYIAKPFSAKELLARVHSHLEIARVRGGWTKELERTNKELEAFSYSVSHDLRAPLRHINWFGKCALEKHGEVLGEGGRRYIESIRTETQKMSGLIDDLLGLSRITTGPLQRKPINLTLLVRKISEELREKDLSRNVAVEIADGLVTSGDARLIAIAITNILGNAWKFTAKRRSAEISVGRTTTGDESPFFIKDNGAGFDMAGVDRLFVPFRRLHTATDFEGTGIGLATAQRIVARHGGRIWADSVVGKGATFFFTFGGRA